MGRKAVPLTPLAIGRLSKPGLHFVGHISGLALNVSGTGARSWILRAVVGNKRKDIGLGSFPEVSLAKARDMATSKRQLISDGIDPVEARRAAKQALKDDQLSSMTFKQAADKYISVHKAGWKNEKHIAQWSSTLDTYAVPTIGDLHVRDITLTHIMAICAW